MKTKTIYSTLLLTLLISFSSSSQIPAIVRDWIDFAGIQDTLFTNPIVTDENGCSYTAGFVMSPTHGADIHVLKYTTSTGGKIWDQMYTSAGYYRDQATGIVLDDSNNVYVCGFTYTSAANNFDYILLKYNLSGALQWTATYNGTASGYDTPCGIIVNGNYVYVTGICSDSASGFDYTTIQYDKGTGALQWAATYDYAGLYDIPFALAVDGSNGIVVTGGSQNSLVDWDFANVYYDVSGNETVRRYSGTGAGFDRALAIKSDRHGNIYITGATVTQNDGLDMKTLKISAVGNILWTKQYDYDSEDDIANDLIVDTMGNVYVCGQSKSSTSADDYILIKYDSTGRTIWENRYDVNLMDDAAKKMTFDALGNIVLVGESKTGDYYDFLTVAYDTSGMQVWKDFFDGIDHLNDKGSYITSDALGNILVTGQTTQNGDYQYVTIKYRTDYYTTVPDSEATPANYAFYPNTGQIIDIHDSVRNDIGYYTLSHYPKLYFTDSGVSYVFSHIDADTTTADTLHRIDMSFDGSTNFAKAYPINELDSDGYLNYFLPQCPSGIVDVHGYQKLIYTNVYPGIDVEFSSNDAGMKFYFIIKPGDTKYFPALHFEGADHINIVSNWGLQLVSSIGSYEYDKPRVYQVDSSGNRVQLSWQCSYYMVDASTVGFILGTYDNSKTLVIEVAKVTHPTSVLSGAPTWGTYYGDVGNDYGRDVSVDNNANVYVTGSTSSINFPWTTGAYDTTQAGDLDIFIARFDQNGVRAWSTFYGGNALDQGYSIAFDQDTVNKIYVTGKTQSQSDFPPFTTGASNCYQQINFFGANWKAYILQLTASNGFPTWATEFGSFYMYGSAVDVDADHNVFLAGHSVVGVQTRFECNADSSNYFPICDPGNNAYVQDWYNSDTPYNYWPNSSDAFIAKFNKQGELKWSTLFGGGRDNSLNLTGNDFISDLAVDKARDVFYIVGSTTSGRSCDSSYCKANNGFDCRAVFPLCPGNSSAFFQDTINSGNFSGAHEDGFITKFSTGGNMLWSTYIGGISDDWTGSVATNSSGDVYLSGATFNGHVGRLCHPSFPNSPGFPICDTTNSYFQDFAGGNLDAFIMRFDTAGQMKWSTWIGGYGPEDVGFSLDHGAPALAIDGRDYVYMCGTTQSPYSSGQLALPTLSSPTVYYQGSNADGFTGRDGYIVAFDNNNHRIWETYLGALGEDYGSGAAAFGSSRLFVTGWTASASGFPTWRPLTNSYWVDQNPGPANTTDAFIDAFDVNAVIGINELENPVLNFIIYPNPNSGIFTVEMELIKNSWFTLIVYDVLGRIVYENKNPRQVGKVVKRIDLSGAASGMYVLSVQTSEAVLTAKLLKQ